MTAITKPYPGTQAVLRAIAILKCFDDTHQTWRLSELARELDLNKTTAFRLLSALESEGLVARDEGTETYGLGPEVVTLGAYALRGIDLRAVARPSLERLAAVTGETASLELLSGDDMLIVDEVVGDHLVSGVRSLGTRWPLHGTSTGLAVLATWPESRLNTYLSQRLEAVTTATITDAARLRGFLAEVSSLGYAVSDEMLEPGLVAIGATVVNHDHQVEAAISIYGPKARLHGGRINDFGRLVRDVAAEISSKLGFRP